MQTQIAPEFAGTPEGHTAERILRACVHCGFCTATCPTYQLLGDELDGPRGRIYLIKQVLEGEPPTAKTQTHLDRCLTCRNCESTCPSGVEYGKLLDIGRAVVERKVPRSGFDKLKRDGLRGLLKSPALFDAGIKIGQLSKGLLPKVLADKIPYTQAKTPAPAPQKGFSRQALLLGGCVQPSLAADINPATVVLLNAIGMGVTLSPPKECCGSLDHHLNAHDAAKAQVKHNIDAWWPLVEQGLEAIIGNASGCSVMLKDYGHFMANDPLYATKANQIAALAKDISEVIYTHWAELKPKLRPVEAEKIAYHPPCTLQHGMKLKGQVETMLSELGYHLLPIAEGHLCCGSAGTYSVLQPVLSNALKTRKLGHLEAHSPSQILSANIGCLTHLQSGTTTPVRHWVAALALHLKS